MSSSGLKTSANLLENIGTVSTASGGELKPIDLTRDVRSCAGPTLIQVNAPPDTSIFGRIHRMVQPADSVYELYIEAKQLCRDTYKTLQYSYDMDVVENMDRGSILLYEKNSANNIISTMRICLDVDCGLPITECIGVKYTALRKRGLSLAEPGRFVVNSDSNIYRRYVSAAYELGKYCGVDAHLLQVRSEQVNFYRRYCAARTIPNSTAPKGCTNMIWTLADTPKVFFRVFGRHRQELHNALISGELNDYRYL